MAGRLDATCRRVVELEDKLAAVRAAVGMPVGEEDVQRVARKYLNFDVMAVLVVGKWDEIAPGDATGRASMKDFWKGERTEVPLRDPLTMKPKDAAAIFNGMEDDLLTDIAKSMKPATLAAVLSSMQPKRAEMVTRLLANLAKPPANLTTPTSAPAAPASPAAPAAPPASPA